MRRWAFLVVGIVLTVVVPLGLLLVALAIAGSP